MEVRSERREDVNQVEGESKRIVAWEQHVQGSCGGMEYPALKANVAGRR